MSRNEPTPNPKGHGEQLRDARLVRALEHAPDVLEAAPPAAALRASILRAAHEAVAAAPAAPRAPVTPWWSRWTAWLHGDASSGRMPWNAAFATVLLAGFITLLWRDEPVPPAQVDGPAPAVQQEAAAPPPPPAPPAPPAATPPAPVEVPAHNIEKEAKKSAPPPVRPRPAAPAETARDIATGTPPVARESAVAAAPGVSLLPPPLSPPPPPSPAPPAAPAAAPARAETQAPVDAGMAAADSAAPAAKAKQQERAAPSTALSAARRAAVAPPALPADWTHVRRADAATAPDGVPRAAAGELPRLLGTLKSGGEADAAATPWGTDGLNPTPVARVTLLRGGSVLGVLELSGQRWRFVPEPGSGLAAHQGVLPDAEARALLAALQRVAP